MGTPLAEGRRFVLETSRLTLRPVRPVDADELLAIFTDPDVRRFLLDDEVVGGEWVEDEVRRSDALFRELGCGLWTIRLRGAAPIVGFVGFRHFFDPPELQLLYGLTPSHWRRGLATEAATAVVRYAFRELGFERVDAATDLPNVASIGVMERLGMEADRERTSAGSPGTVWYSVERGRWTGGRGPGIRRPRDSMLSSPRSGTFP